jgi:hypothetical protein
VSLLTAGCTATLAPTTSEFGQAPFAPFSREAVVAIALREWRLFGSRYDDRSVCPDDRPPNPDPPERAEGLWQRVGEYRRLGLGSRHPHRAWTGKHDGRGHEYSPEEDARYAWSAAFVSYVMRVAGAGDGFPYDDLHATYIDAAARAARGEWPGGMLVAMRPEYHPPAPGDLVCAGRAWAERLRFDDLPAGRFPSHCMIVVEVQPEALLVVGGNVDDAVTLTRLPISTVGTLVRLDGSSVDRCAFWFVVLAVQYER